MAIQIIIYIVFLLAIAAYVGINIFHLVRFRLGFRGDKTGVVIAIYLLIVLGILALSWFGAFIAYESSTL